MTVPLATVPGGYFTRIGHIGHMASVANTQRGTTIPGLLATLVGDLATGDPNDAAILQASLAGLQSGSTGFLGTLQTLASNITIAMAAADQIQPNANFTTAWQYIYNQMILDAQTVQRNTIGISTTSNGSNTGNPVIVLSTLNANGLPMEYQFAEVISGVCTGDSQTGTATALQEPIQFTGQQAAASTIAFNYPAGSGITKVITCVNALVNQTGGVGNYLNNGSFESFAVTPNLPDFFHAITGTPGTQILQSTAQHYDGTSSLQLVGDSATDTAVYQAFKSDTSVPLTPSTQYAVVIWLRVDVVPAAGVFQLALTDGTNTITTDFSANSNSATKSLTGLAANTWTPFTMVIRTPKVVPSVFRLRLSLSTALSTGTNLFLDRCGFTAMNQLYLGGPSVAAFSANLNQVIGDNYTITSTNGRGGLLQSSMDVLLPMKVNGFLVPSLASGATVPDSLFI